MTIDDILNQDWDNFDEEKHQEELYANIASLTEQNNLLGETLKMILVEIGLAEHIAHDTFNDGIGGMYKYIKKNLMADLRACVDEIAKDYAEYETEVLKKRMDEVFERHDKAIDSLYKWRARSERK